MRVTLRGLAGTAFGDVGASRLANACFVAQGVVPE